MLLLQAASALFAQTVQAVYNTANSPLPHNQIRCLATGAEGTLWIGTEYGAASFNGNIWQVFTPDNSPLPHYSVRCITVDAQNSVWLGTFNGGLARYDNGEWTIYNTANSGLPDNYVKSIAFDSEQNLWLGLSGGLAKYDGVNWQLFTAIGPDLLLNNVNDVTFDQQKQIWVGTVNGGLATTDVNGMLFAYNLANSGVPDNTLNAIATDAQNQKWMTTPADGVGKFDGINWFTYSTANSALPANSATDVWVNPLNNAVWVGTTTGGAAYYNPNTDEWTAIPPTAGLPDAHITAITGQVNGAVWLGTQVGGLVKWYDNTNNLPNVEPHRVQVYPNPATDRLCLHTASGLPPHARFRLLSVTSGKTVLQSSVQQPCFDVTYLPAGLYWVVLQVQNRVIFSQKALILH